MGRNPTEEALCSLRALEDMIIKMDTDDTENILPSLRALRDRIINVKIIDSREELLVIESDSRQECGSKRLKQTSRG